MKVFLLIAATGVSWLIATGVAVAIAGSEHWLPSGVAVLLCLLPAVGTLVLAGWSERRGPVEALGFVLVAPLVRLIASLGAGVLIGALVPALRADPARFAFWGAGMYLVTLVIETGLLLSGMKPRAGSPEAPAEPRGG